MTEKQIDFLNKYISKAEIWRVTDQTIKNKCLYICFEMIRIIAFLLECFVPKACNAILDTLNIPLIVRNQENLWFRKKEKIKNENETNFHYEEKFQIFLKLDLAKKKTFFMKKLGK